jgi:NADH:ubiquinone oxidoreductase subunit 3 (subunit A)
MTISDILLTPPIAAGIFLALAYGLFRLGKVLAAPGEPSPGKHEPYACGEDLLPPEAQMAYHAFFQLALMFALLHLATLIVSTLPADGSSRYLALVYLAAIVVSVLVLTKEPAP